MKEDAKTPGRPALGGTRRQVTTSAVIESLLTVYMQHNPDLTDAQALRRLLKLGLETWLTNLEAE